MPIMDHTAEFGTLRQTIAMIQRKSGALKITLGATLVILAQQVKIPFSLRVMKTSMIFNGQMLLAFNPQAACGLHFGQVMMMTMMNEPKNYSLLYLPLLQTLLSTCDQ